MRVGSTAAGARAHQQLGARVLIPLKRLARAKTRLSPALDAGARADLMRTLLEGVLAAVAEAGIERITVVTSEPLAEVEVWNDGDLPWNDALAAAMRNAATEPIATIISADLSHVCAADVAALVLATPVRGIAIARAHDGGTNAISMRPPGLVRTHFGESRSAALHASLGVDHVMLDLPGLAFDVDTPADLEQARARMGAAP